MNMLVIADDVGFSSSVDRASLKALQCGSLSALSLMPCGPSFTRTAAALSSLGVTKASYHLTLGEPTQHSASRKDSALINRTGSFCDRQQTTAVLEEGTEELSQWLHDEIDAQLSRLLDWGFKIVHLCGHRHFHLLPVVRQTLVQVWNKRGLPAPVVRGYNTSLPSLTKSNAYPLLCKYAESAGVYYRACGWSLSSTIGFSWNQDPSWLVMQGEIRQAASLAKANDLIFCPELMLHLAEYKESEPRLSLFRDRQQQEYNAIYKQDLLRQHGFAVLDLS